MYDRYFFIPHRGGLERVQAWPKQFSETWFDVFKKLGFEYEPIVIHPWCHLYESSVIFPRYQFLLEVQTHERFAIVILIEDEKQRDECLSLYGPTTDRQKRWMQHKKGFEGAIL